MSTDAELIGRVLEHNDRNAFSDLVLRHQSVIRQFLRRVSGGDHALADDIAQETFWLAYQKLHTYKSLGSFPAWLHTLAWRLFLKQLPKIETVTFDEDYMAPVSNPAGAADADMAAEKLMRQLTLPERVVITLTYAAGMSHQEVVAITGLPLGTVKSHIRRGRNRLLAFRETAEVA